MQSENNQAGDPLADLSTALAARVEAVAPAVLALPGRRGRAIASALLWRDDLVVTVAHVFRRSPPGAASLVTGDRTVEAAVVGVDPSTDLAVLRLPAGEALPAPAIGSADGVRVGHLAIAVGRTAEGDVVASHGIVNRVGGPWQSWLGGQLDRLVRLDGGVYDGLSGGPVLDAEGRVIGLATAALSRSYGMVIPSSTVTRVVDALASRGRVARPYLGISGQSVALPGEPAREGLLVTGLVGGGPAAQAGLMVGDILAQAAGQPAGSLAALRTALADRVGQVVSVSLLRGGQPLELSLAVGEWPAASERRRC